MNLEQAITESIAKMAGRKNGAAIIGMAFIYLLKDQPWQTLVLVTCIAVTSIFLQFVLDIVERKWLGKDLPENGVEHDSEPTSQPENTPVPKPE